MNQIGLIKRYKTALLIVDIQERLMPVIAEKELVFTNANKLIAGANILKLPIIVTEQYPKGLGHTCPEIKLPDNQLIIEKNSFSCMLSNEVQMQLKALAVTSLIIVGVESHVCVFKTALDALANNFEVHIIADAVSSRKLFDKEIALARLRQSGAFIASTEMILFQLIDEAGNDEFRQISRLIK